MQEKKQKQEIKRLREKNRETSRLLVSAADSQVPIMDETQDDLDILPPSEIDSAVSPLIKIDLHLYL